jgi:Fis family transcriptional regulator
MTRTRKRRATVHANGAACTVTAHLGPLHECVVSALDAYFVAHAGEAIVGLYDQLTAAVEKPLLEVVMREVHGNQTHAAAVLGVNRGTLRKKLKQHGLLVCD